MVVLKMNPRGSKHVHVEDAKNWIKALILRSLHFVGLHYLIVSQFKVQKKNWGYAHAPRHEDTWDTGVKLHEFLPSALYKY